MELCTTTTTTTTTRAISSVHYRRRVFSTSNPTHFRFNFSLLLPQNSPSRTMPELRHLNSPLLRSEKRSSRATWCYGEERDDVTTLEVVPLLEKSVYDNTVPTGVSEDDSAMDEQTQGFELLDKLNIQVDSADTSSIALFGSGALVALWFASAIVGAIDAIPVFPKLMEVVGLAYTFWFSTRYLLFKNNRDELAAKIEQLKQQVLGSIED